MAGERIWTIYKITGKCGRAYIGITKSKLRYRLRQHLKCAANGEQSVLWRYMAEINDPSWFSIEPIAECYSSREAIACERAMICVHNTYYKQGGLNRNMGGGGNVKDGISEEVRQRLSAAQKKVSAENPHNVFIRTRAYNEMGRPVSPEGHQRKLEGLRSAHKPEIWAKGGETRRKRFADPVRLKEKVRNEREWIAYEKALAYRVGRVRPHRFHPSYIDPNWSQKCGPKKKAAA